MKHFPPSVFNFEPHQELKIYNFRKSAPTMREWEIVDIIKENVLMFYENRNRLENCPHLTFEQEIHLKEIEKFYISYPKEILIKAANLYLVKNMLFQNMVIYSENCKKFKPKNDAK